MDEEKFMGYDLFEASQRAIDVGTIGAWEWFQAWFKADLDASDPPPEEW